jgi:hypothetical protein
MRLWILAILLTTAWPALAVHFTPSQTGPATWQYTLTFDPLDNYSISQTNTTITLSGLSGVTAATGPTSTDFPPALNATNLAWTAQVLNGGTKVVWTIVGGGTGNFGTAMHVFGFSVTAAAAQNGTATFATSGMSRDTGSPLPGGGFNLDVTGSVAGPVAAGGPGTGTAVGAPAATPLSLMIAALGLAAIVLYTFRNTQLQTRE